MTCITECEPPKLISFQPVSEYKRQYTWHEIAPADPMAGCPSFKEKKVAEPPLQAKQRPTLELASKEGENQDVKLR